MEAEQRRKQIAEAARSPSRSSASIRLVALVVVVGAGQSAAELKGLRQAIDQLTFPTPHQREKREALLPRTETDSGKVAEPEEEDDEEEFDTLVSGA